MSSSSIKLRNLRKSYPEETETVSRLEGMLSNQQFTENHEFTLDRLYDLTNPASMSGLALILGELVKMGILDLSYRIESPEKKGGIKDYSSLDEIPTEIVDWHTEKEIEVTPDLLRVLYKRRH